MKIPIETKEEKDQPEEENEAWMEKLHHNAAIMSACMDAFPDKPECVWVALFKSLVPSASPGDIGKLLNVGFGLLGKAEKTMDGLIMFDHDEPPEPPPVAPEVFEGGGPAVLDKSPVPPLVPEPIYITVGTTATLLYENQSGKSRRITVSNNDVIQDLWIGTQDVNHYLGNMIPKTERRAVDVPAGRSLWGITSAGIVRVRIGLNDGSGVFLENIFEPTSDDMPVCQLCGSSDLTQAVYQMVGSERKKGYVCLKCVRNLITDYQESLKALEDIPDSDSIPAEKPVCCLCGSSDLLQTVYLHGKVTARSDSYIIPSTGQIVSISDSFICMKCLRKLIEKERQNAG